MRGIKSIKNKRGVKNNRGIKNRSHTRFMRTGKA